MKMIPKFVAKVLHSEGWLKLDVLLKFSMIKLRSASSRCESIESYVELASNALLTLPFLYANIQPSQVKSEIVALLKILAKSKPQYLLEIGTARGGTLYLFTKIASEDATIISVDLPGGCFGSGYSGGKITYYKSFATRHEKIHLLRENSHLERTLNTVQNILSGHNLDFLFIDGDHTYTGVKADFEMYSPLVRQGGLIALHDICVEPDPTCKVRDYWNEIKDRFNSMEIVNDPHQGWAGIGVIYV